MKKNALWISVRINSPCPELRDSTAKGKTQTQLLLVLNCSWDQLHKPYFGIVPKFLSFAGPTLTHDYRSSPRAHCTAWSANQIIFLCIMERRLCFIKQTGCLIWKVFWAKCWGFVANMWTHFFSRETLQSIKWEQWRSLRAARQHRSHLPTSKTAERLKSPT